MKAGRPRRNSPAPPVPAASRNQLGFPRQSAVRPAPARASVLLIAIAGGSGSGKSWLAAELARRLRPHAARLSLDDFYLDLAALPVEVRERKNFDIPQAIDWPLFEACLDQIRAGETLRIPRYDFSTHTRRTQSRLWRPRPIVLVEGLWPWWQPAVRRHYALRIFRAGLDKTLFARRLERDVAERGRTPQSIERQWREQVRPMFRRFVLPQARSADVRLPCQVPEARLARLVSRIRSLAGLVSARTIVGSRTH